MREEQAATDGKSWKKDGKDDEVGLPFSGESKSL